MSEFRINATLWKTSKDHEGEVTMSFKVPKSDQFKAMAIPDGVNLILNVECGDAGNQ